MLCLIDPHLLAIDLTQWNTDRSKCFNIISSMDIHAEYMQKYPVRLLWDDNFLDFFMDNDTPKGLMDFYTLIYTFYERMIANNKIINIESIECLQADLNISPNLLQGDMIERFKDIWMKAFTYLVIRDNHNYEGLAVFSYQHNLCQGFGEVEILNHTAISSCVESVRLIFLEGDWTRFVKEFHRPNLENIKIAILGGKRADSERAIKQLRDEYNMENGIWLPPSWEENRTKKETIEKIKQVDAVVVCHDCLDHSYYGQIKNSDFKNKIIYPKNYNLNQIVQCVVEYFAE